MGRVTVQVACESITRWRIHVQATVIQEMSLWSLTRQVRSGEILDPSMLRQERVLVGDATSPRRLPDNPVTELTHALGLEFRRPARSGELLDDAMLQARKLVLKGEAVILVNSRPGLRLQVEGVALSDAPLGARLQIRNAATGKIVEAVVLSRGVVEALVAP